MSASLPIRVLLSSANTVSGGWLNPAIATVNFPGTTGLKLAGSWAMACGFLAVLIGVLLASRLTPVPLILTFSAQTAGVKASASARISDDFCMAGSLIVV